MDPITEAAAGGSEQAPITIVTADGDGKLSVAQAARALAATNQENNSRLSSSARSPPLPSRRRGSRRQGPSPSSPRRNPLPLQAQPRRTPASVIPAFAGTRLPPARLRVPIRQPPSRRPSSHRGLGRRQTRSSSPASLARRKSELRSASGHGRATFSAVRPKPSKSSKASVPRSRRWIRRGSSTKPPCRSSS
jgi:hypothetical protein